jgi:RES domain-containing protein
MQVWRIFPERFRATAFTGVGGLYAARRWNHLGTLMVYCATSPALATLELFVNLDPNEAPDDLLMAAVEIRDDQIEQLELELLPSDWRELNNLACRDFGSGWVASGRSMALRVPSAVVDGDWNVLLNPRHADFSKIQVAAHKPFRFDGRMFR